VLAKPEGGAPFPLPFDHTVTVAQALATLAREKRLREGTRYGLYHAAVSVWLSDTRTLESYDLDEKVPCAHRPSAAHASDATDMALLAPSCRVAVAAWAYPLAASSSMHPPPFHSLLVLGRRVWVGCQDVLEIRELSREVVLRISVALPASLLPAAAGTAAATATPSPPSSSSSSSSGATQGSALAPTTLMVRAQLSQTMGEVVAMAAREAGAESGHLYGLYLAARQAWLADTRYLKDLDVDGDVRWVSVRVTACMFVPWRTVVPVRCSNHHLPVKYKTWVRLFVCVYMCVYASRSMMLTCASLCGLPDQAGAALPIPQLPRADADGRTGRHVGRRSHGGSGRHRPRRGRVHAVRNRGHIVPVGAERAGERPRPRVRMERGDPHRRPDGPAGPPRTPTGCPSRALRSHMCLMLWWLCVLRTLAQECLVLRPAGCPLYFTPSYDPGATVAIDVDPALPLTALLPSVRRRFGLREQDCAGLAIAIAPDQRMASGSSTTPPLSLCLSTSLESY
jgi:hypothetical protein